MAETTTPIIVAHRGLHRVHPENSAAALRLAIEEGFWVECDVHAAADRVPVIFHDDALDRLTAAAGPVAGRTARDLSSLTLRNAAGAMTEERVPLLEGLVRGPTAAEGVWLIEIKPPDSVRLTRDVVEMMRGSRLEWIVQSFDAANVVHAWSVDPAVDAALLVGDEAGLDVALNDDWPRVHVEHRLLDRSLADRLRERGCLVGAWTVNERPDVDRVLDLRPDMVITDEPWRVRDALEARGGHDSTRRIG